MIVFPRTNKIIGDLNSYYTLIPKLVEHYQGILNSGCVYFKSPASGGVIFFDEENIISSFVVEKNKVFRGQNAVDLLQGNFELKNYSIYVYEIDQDFVTFWANLYDKEEISHVSSFEPENLDSLFKEYSDKKLTGYIDIKDSGKGHYLFFCIDGHFIYSTSKNIKYEPKSDMSALESLKAACASGKNKVSLDLSVNQIPLDQKVLLLKTNDSNENESLNKQEAKLNFIEMLQNLMVLFEKYFDEVKKNKDSFHLLLKKKFLEKVDIYEFLDPFTAEFNYSDGEISFTGKETPDIVSLSVINCLKEISLENKMTDWLKKYLVAFQEKYKKELNSLKIKIV